MTSRDEHRRATLRSLSDAAIELFEEIGPKATIKTIAERAGVSRRTVFRYVDAKEELAFIHPELWFDVFEEGLRTTPDPGLEARLRHASRQIALHIDDDPEPPRRAFLVVAANPELARGYTAVFQRWVDRVAAEVDADESRPGAAASTAHDRFRARIVGAAVMGMVDAVVREWLRSPAGTPFADLYDAGFELLTPLISSPRCSS